MIIFVAFKYFQFCYVPSILSRMLKLNLQTSLNIQLRYVTRQIVCRVSFNIKIMIVAMKDSVKQKMQILAVATSKKSLSSQILKHFTPNVLSHFRNIVSAESFFLSVQIEYTSKNTGKIIRHSDMLQWVYLLEDKLKQI